jgi:hypothetical protein
VIFIDKAKLNSIVYTAYLSAEIVNKLIAGGISNTVGFYNFGGVFPLFEYFNFCRVIFGEFGEFFFILSNNALQ